MHEGFLTRLSWPLEAIGLFISVDIHMCVN